MEINISAKEISFDGPEEASEWEDRITEVLDEMARLKASGGTETPEKLLELMCNMDAILLILLSSAAWLHFMVSHMQSLDIPTNRFHFRGPNSN